MQRTLVKNNGEYRSLPHQHQGTNKRYAAASRDAGTEAPPFRGGVASWGGANGAHERAFSGVGK